ncbi:hypothetical protein [Kribbella sp. NPDC023855]|uniref:hypothetical protein n=1 Tax=Kribbella sp. NPDC023855 TaxID=3154698 RepID=UPI0033C3DFEA
MSQLAGVDTQRRAVLRRLPGKARPARETLEEYNRHNDERRRHIPNALWSFFAPSPDKLYRWRVQLDCECVVEVLTSGKDSRPDEQRWRDPVSSALLPCGQISCWHDAAPPAPYREIIDWGDRRLVSFEADPVEPPDWAGEEIWAALRRDEPRRSAFWTVTLSCGHVTDAVCDPAWKPSDGPKLASIERTREMKRQFEEYWSTHPGEQDERERMHWERMLQQRWPRPSPEALCSTCTHVRQVVACQRAGWLVPRMPQPEQPKPPSKEALRRRLKKAEAEAARLRSQLAEIDGEDQ